MSDDSLKLIALGTYGVLFLIFTYFTGAALRKRGWTFLSNTFEQRRGVADSVQFLLSLGFYLTCLSLLLWNLGTDPSGSWSGKEMVFTVKDIVQTVATRLGISIFVVSVFHTINLLTLAVLNKKYEGPK
ncbi:MAG: hypothetical protein WDZ66_04760 [Steroidobacteraceae bacterium]